MLDRLPVQIDPLGFAERKKMLSGFFEQNKLTRLSDVLQDTSGVVEVYVAFDKEGRLPTVEGEIKADLVLQCQNCLDHLVLPVNKTFKLGIVDSLEQADKLASDIEPYMLENETISLIELVEDELLLALPDFPRHVSKCDKKNVNNEMEINGSEQSISNNPFSILAELKKSGD